MAIIYSAEKQRRQTGIEWTTATWNPFVGCSIKSEGCHNCYAMSLAYRLEAMGQKSYEGTAKIVNGKKVWTGKINRSSQSVWVKPARVKEPSIFFVNSMSDFFHKDAPYEWQLEAMNIMKSLNRHQFQVLTKRPELILAFLEKSKWDAFPNNVWIGATVENERAKDRIELIKNIPAKIKFLSIEPLIGSIGKVSFKGIDWVITGGESGPGARSMDANWIREVRDQCLNDKVPHFFKQYGIPENNPLFAEAPIGISGAAWVYKNDPQGKGGSMIDGKYFKEMPEGFEVPEYEEELAFNDMSKA